MSHLFEFAAHNAPLMIIQFYNNGSQNSFSKPTDAIIKMNIAFSILNIVDLILEMILTQIVNKDNEFSILSKAKIGIVEDSSSEESDSYSDSDTDKVEVKEVMSFDQKLQGSKPLTHKEKLRLRNQEDELINKFRNYNDDLLYMTIISLIVFGIFYWGSATIFEMSPCPINSFEKDEVCLDCTNTL